MKQFKMQISTQTDNKRKKKILQQIKTTSEKNKFNI